MRQFCLTIARNAIPSITDVSALHITPIYIHSVKVSAPSRLYARPVRSTFRQCDF